MLRQGTRHCMALSVQNNKMKGWHAGETAGGGTFSETVAQTIEIDPYSVLLRNVDAFLKHTLEDVVHPAGRTKKGQVRLPVLYSRLTDINLN